MSSKVYIMPIKPDYLYQTLYNQPERGYIRDSLVGDNAVGNDDTVDSGEEASKRLKGHHEGRQIDAVALGALPLKPRQHQHITNRYTKIENVAI